VLSAGLYCLMVVLLLLSGCKNQGISPSPTAISPTSTFPTILPTLIPTRLLTICIGKEPSSLFIYNDSSISAQNIRQAIYDGPFDVNDFQYEEVILENIPTIANNEIFFEPITVNQGDLIIDSNGNLLEMSNGTSFLPAGCKDASCVSVSDGQTPVQMDHLFVQYKLLNGIKWSDGQPLTANDSVYSYEIAKALYPRARSELISITQTYKALNETTIEWKGIPGYRGSDVLTNFFSPLPRHAWGHLPFEELLSNETVNRSPLGWGPYVIDEWTVGDHITLSRSTNYYRNLDGLPTFDTLVFRFVPDADEATAALLAGECDYLDESTRLESNLAQLITLQEEGQIRTLIDEGAAWEHLDFGIIILNPSLLGFFHQKEARQAVAWCLDRQRIVDEVFSGNSLVAENYIPPKHPLFNPEIKRYSFDPSTGIRLLDSVGWLDQDGNTSTPRLAQGVDGIPDGTALEMTLLTTDEEEKGKVAQIMQESLAQCGIKINISSMTPSEFYAPGPEGLVFGRNFSLSQFGWISPNNVILGVSPPCSLYTSPEIPGPYPEYPRGWGGANVAGYSNQEFDQTCQLANSTLPEDPRYQSAHYQAQLVFTDELPALPLYLRPKIVAMRPDICLVDSEVAAGFSLSKIELINYGEDCD